MIYHNFNEPHILRKGYTHVIVFPLKDDTMAFSLAPILYPSLHDDKQHFTKLIEYC